MNNNLEKIHSMPAWKAVLSNSVPAMMAMIMMLIYNIADLFFVGQTGETLQVTAVSMATPIFLFCMSFGSVFGVGGTTVCSKAFGRGDAETVRKASAFCIWSSIIVGVCVSLLLLFNAGMVVELLGATPEVYDMVKGYIQIIAISGPFLMLSACMSNLLRAEGKSKQAMVGMMLGNVINIILDPIFILVLEMGVEGAAIATAIGNAIGGLYYVRILVKRQTTMSVSIKDFKLESSIAKSVLYIGIPASLSTMLMSISQIVLNEQMTAYGNLAVAGIGVATKVSMMTSILFIGLGQGVQPLFAYCIGAEKKERYKGMLRFSLIFALCFSTILTLLCYFNLETIVGLFLSEAEAFTYAYEFSQIRLPTSVLFGMFFVLLNALQGMGAAKSSLVVNISRQGLIFIPLVFILGAQFGEFGLVLAQPIADVLSFILVLSLYAITAKGLFQDEKGEVNKTGAVEPKVLKV